MSRPDCLFLACSSFTQSLSFLETYCAPDIPFMPGNFQASSIDQSIASHQWTSEQRTKITAAELSLVNWNQEASQDCLSSRRWESAESKIQQLWNFGKNDAFRAWNLLTCFFRICRVELASVLNPWALVREGQMVNHWPFEDWASWPVLLQCEICCIAP